MNGPLLVDEARPVPHGHTARRLEWQHLPPVVRRRVEERLGSPVVEARSQGAGFTPGFASRLRGEDGSWLFVKAANLKAQRQIAAAYAREARMLAALPVELPLPRLRWAEEIDTWTVLATDDVEGRYPVRPWRCDELLRCLDALAVVDDVMNQGPAGARHTWGRDTWRPAPLHEELPTLVTGWDAVAGEVPDWPHLSELRMLAHGYADLPDADHFVHSDARDDNFLLTSDPGAAGGTALLCDWSWPALGPRWLDAVALLASARADCEPGLDADALLAQHRLTAAAPAEHVDAWLAALCGYMVEADLRPVPRSSPYLGVHRRWWSAALWEWLCDRRGWRP